LYGARFRSFPVQEDAHFLKVCRYIERNPLRAGRVARAEHWPWGSLHQRQFDSRPQAGKAEANDAEPKAPVQRPCAAEVVDAWPVARPRDWVQRVNEPGTAVWGRRDIARRSCNPFEKATCHSGSIPSQRVVYGTFWVKFALPVPITCWRKSLSFKW
jgi:hypothetical protein